MASQCRAGAIARKLDPEDLQKIHDLRKSKVTWFDIASALNRAGHTGIAGEGLRRHFMNRCRCEDMSAKSDLSFSFTSVTKK